MTIPAWCWRCRREVPMLDETEWAVMQPLIVGILDDIKRHRAEHDRSLPEALEDAADPAFGSLGIDTYARLTGLREPSVSIINHHRRAAFGPDCQFCAKPLRTPRASYCAACGAMPITSAAPST